MDTNEHNAKQSEIQIEVIRNAKPGDRTMVYIACSGTGMRRGLAVTTWTGEPVGTVLSVGAVHAWSARGCFGERHYIRVIDKFGHEWSGTGAPGMNAPLRRCKGGVK